MREVNVQGFLSDRVIRMKGQLISRGDLLRFVCYHDFGVHYSGREEAVFDLIRGLRNMLTFFAHSDGVLGVSISDHLDSKKPAKMLMDLTHIHTFSTGYYLTKSPDIAGLQALIEAEIASAEAAAEDGKD